MHRSATLALALVIGAAAVILGCAAPQYTPTLYYTVEPVIEVAEAEPTEESLGLRPFQAERPYRQRMMFRETGHVLQGYPNAEWAKAPAQTTFRALLDAVTETGRFGDVGNAADMPRPDYMLLGSIRKFEEDRTQDPPAAVVEVRLELRRGDDRSAVWTGVLRGSEPLPQPGPSGYAEAMNAALGQWASEAAEQIAAAG